jgi:hypothetical protein
MHSDHFPVIVEGGAAWLALIMGFVHKPLGKAVFWGILLPIPVLLFGAGAGWIFLDAPIMIGKVAGQAALASVAYGIKAGIMWRWRRIFHG